MKNKFIKTYGDMILSRLVLPYILYTFIRNSVYFYQQRSIIKKTLLSSQKLVDAVDENGFWLDKYTYALNNIQLLNANDKGIDNLHPETIKRTVLYNINEVFAIDNGVDILNNTTFEVDMPTDKVMYIRLAPTWLKAFYVSLVDLGYCILSNFVIFLIIYFMF